jgi:phosphoribosylaminoimidazolecarboxamide formyltransferase/IMP cyclohydrolase
MENMKKINSALVSVYHKDRLDEIVKLLVDNDIKIYSTGGTYDFIKKMGIETFTVESLTQYPSILGGRVKTLHPKVFGGILARRENKIDLSQMAEYGIPEIDLVIVDLYPFEETVAQTTNQAEIIEKIDIGGISLIRAAAKNYNDVAIIPSKEQYDFLINLLKDKNGCTTLEDRLYLATQAFNVSSHYDSAIFGYFQTKTDIDAFKFSVQGKQEMRYGENPHQKGAFYGDLDKVFKQLHGKAISYNNLIDLESAMNLVNEFTETTFAIIKHTNPCGIASRDIAVDAWKAALAGDPVSAYGGVIATNCVIDIETAQEINKLFFEIIFAEGYNDDALEVLKSKKNRIILQKKPTSYSPVQFRSVLNGVLVQDKDLKVETVEDLKVVTTVQPDSSLTGDLLFANIVVKHTKSNAIVVVKDKQLLGTGVGQTSRVDSTKHAIEKAHEFGFDLNGSVLASDAFFPFADCVEIAHKAGVIAFIQPGGSVRDQDSIDYCNKNDLPMIMTGFRHFKH